MQVTHHDWRALGAGPSSSCPRHHWARGETRRLRPAAPAETRSRSKRLQPPAEPPFPGAAPSPPSSARASRSRPRPPTGPGQGEHCKGSSLQKPLPPTPVVLTWVRSHLNKDSQPSAGPVQVAATLTWPARKAPSATWGDGVGEGVFTVRDQMTQEPGVKICPRGHQDAPLLLLRGICLNREAWGHLSVGNEGYLMCSWHSLLPPLCV